LLKYNSFSLKIGGGTPPLVTRHGWMIIYHGVSELGETGTDEHRLCYAAGLMVLSREQPSVIHCRLAEPVLTPVLPEERYGAIANVVFPTGIDRRDDLGLPGRFDIYYGMGVARLDVPDIVPPGGAADSPEARV
jgi:beta-1,2-mannobiose phosphorylase / 1,2-beta-oligomannan phosphorylase